MPPLTAFMPRHFTAIERNWDAKYHYDWYSARCEVCGIIDEDDSFGYCRTVAIEHEIENGIYDEMEFGEE